MKTTHSHSYGSVAELERPAREEVCAPAMLESKLDYLRRCAWEISERKAADAYIPIENHVGLSIVTPVHAFAHWRICQEWIEKMYAARGHAWHNCRLVLRLYDVSYVIFNGLNAHSIHDVPLGNVCGQQFFGLPRPGTFQLAEVGYLLRSGEFVPAARSRVVQFPRDVPSPQSDVAALYVTDDFKVEPIGNIWDQERILQERRKARVRVPLRIALFSIDAPSGPHSELTRFISGLASGQAALGHEVHIFSPACERVKPIGTGNILYHPLQFNAEGTPLEVARAFGKAQEEALKRAPSFDLIHRHEWQTGVASGHGTVPAIVSLSSIECVRLNGASPSQLSNEIRDQERKLVQEAECILAPDWLRNRLISEYQAAASKIHSFPTEGRPHTEWDTPLDTGKVKTEFGIGPLDRLLLFSGPLEHAAGPDILVEAAPTLLRRWPNLRIAIVGQGSQRGALERRIAELQLGYAVKLVGHLDGAVFTRLLRACEALVLPSRHALSHERQSIDLARRASRPVVVTQSGSPQAVRHEHDGLVTYDNSGSIVWAVDRLLGDPGNASRMGANGCESVLGSREPCWTRTAEYYFEIGLIHFRGIRAATR